MKTCDVIIPVHNNAEVLSETLRALELQIVPPDWKVGIILCDDGSTEPAIPPRSELASTIIRQPHQGAAAARNAAIRASQADIVLLLGADIILRPGAMAAHLTFHSTHTGVHEMGLGFVMWDPRIVPTPLMEWSTHGGPQNDFDALLGAQEADPRRFFYASHVSGKRSLLVQQPFSKQFTGYGYEDAELGHRLYEDGAKLFVIHGAVGLHRHFYTVQDFLQRQIEVGKSTHIYTELTNQPSPTENLSRRHRLQMRLYPFGVGLLLTFLVRMLGSRVSMPRLFGHIAMYMYRKGLIQHSLSSKPR